MEASSNPGNRKAVVTDKFLTTQENIPQTVTIGMVVDNGVYKIVLKDTFGKPLNTDEAPDSGEAMPRPSSPKIGKHNEDAQKKNEK